MSVDLNFAPAPVYVATKTLERIAEVMKADQGASFRRHLRTLTAEALASNSDAFNGDIGDPYRTHLGASSIGYDCARATWYGFRWTLARQFTGQLLRLFNRGHLEEMRFGAMLHAIGCRVWTQFEGRQIRMSLHGGHFGGSCDLVAWGIPDWPDEYLLVECKTHNAESFDKLKSKGVAFAKSEHVVQMQTYMGGLALRGALYLAVCKDTDELYGELLPFAPEVYARTVDKALALVTRNHPPQRINESPAFYLCKMCQYVPVCHYGAPADRNCRTCANVDPQLNGGWLCKHTGRRLNKGDQMDGCEAYLPIRMTA